MHAYTDKYIHTYLFTERAAHACTCVYIYTYIYVCVEAYVCVYKNDIYVYQYINMLVYEHRHVEIPI